jgi:hypothetical protein
VLQVRHLYQASRSRLLHPILQRQQSQHLNQLEAVIFVRTTMVPLLRHRVAPSIRFNAASIIPVEILWATVNSSPALMTA